MSMRAKTHVRNYLRSTQRVLDAIEFGFLMLDVRGRYRHAYMDDGLSGVRRLVEGEERRRLLMHLRDLRRRKLIKERKIGARIMLSLSDSGVVLRLKQAMKGAQKFSDGRCLLVTFDVPEHRRAVRDALRLTLRAAGFTRVHYSVWSSDRDLTKTLCEYLQMRKLDGWIRCYEAVEIE